MPHNTWQLITASGAAPIYGGMVSLESATVVDLFTSIGYDYVVIDCQHSRMDEADASRLLLASADPSVAMLIRVSENRHALIGRALDAGADGVVVPMVNTASEAAAAVAACLYAPKGVRSLGPLRRAMGLDPSTIEARASCFVMAETVEAIDNIFEICAIPHLAGVYVGPADLSLTLAVPLLAQPMPAALLKSLRSVVEACAINRTIAATHAYSAEHARILADLGFQMITLAIDAVYLSRSATDDLAKARAYRGRKDTAPDSAQ